jgi:hypothetical protein
MFVRFGSTVINNQVYYFKADYFGYLSSLRKKYGVKLIF